MISNYLFEVFFYSDSDDLSLIFFSVFRKIVKQHYNIRKIIIPIFFNGLVSLISKKIDFLNFSKNFNSKFFTKLFKKSKLYEKIYDILSSQKSNNLIEKWYISQL